MQEGRKEGSESNVFMKKKKRREEKRREEKRREERREEKREEKRPVVFHCILALCSRFPQLIVFPMNN